MTEGAKKPKQGESILDAANKIWTTGMDAIRAAESEGSKVFKSLVDKGLDFQNVRKEISQKQVAKINEVVKGGYSSVKGKFDDMISHQEGLWEKLNLEETFTALFKTFGVATKRDIDSLTKKLDALSRTIAALKVEPRKAPVKKDAPVAK